MNNRDEMKRLLETTRRTTTFGANYNPKMRYTDTHAPSPGDYAMTPDGKGVVVDTSQNGEGYYVFFDIDFGFGDDDEKFHEPGRYHISAVRKI